MLGNADKQTTFYGLLANYEEFGNIFEKKDKEILDKLMKTVSDLKLDHKEKEKEQFDLASISSRMNAVRQE